ncbi:MAG: transcriptional regulator [Eubacterium sp.]|nr:transcriptional regulator [Eubacterium sp.]SEF52165.1 hypothetical protein SAMN04487934_101445 [Eubacterium ruminantium]
MARKQDRDPVLRDRLVELKESTGMNWRRFAEYFDIPYRTVQDWGRGERVMPEYLLRLMEYKIRMENLDTYAD